MKLLQDDRGSISVWALFTMLVVFSIGAMVSDIGNFACVKISAKHKLNLAVRAAAGQVDMEQLKNANVVIDEGAAVQKFYDVLETNLRLDSALQPLAGSIVDGPVNVVFLKVVNQQELPFTYSYGSFSETITKPAVTAIIEFPVKYGMFGQFAGLGTEANMTVHVTAGPELISKHIGEF